MGKKTLGQLCREARETRGMTQSDAARLTHYERRTISDYERETRTEHLLHYAVSLARAIDDMTLLRQAVAIEVGIPVAGEPVPDNIDHHVASLRDYMGRQIHEAMEAVSRIEVWRAGGDQAEVVTKAAAEMLDAIKGLQWEYDAVCQFGHIDPDEIMDERRSALA